jgi:hypothetical protein
MTAGPDSTGKICPQCRAAARGSSLPRTRRVYADQQQIGKKGVFDTSNGTTTGTPLNSNAARFTSPASIQVDRQSGEIRKQLLRSGALPASRFGRPFRSPAA